MDYSKIVGWLVFFAGLLLIIWTLYSSYSIFTGKSLAPAFFEVPKQTSTQKAGSQDVQAQLQQMLQEQLKGFLPEGGITEILNLAIWSMLAFILISGGAQISGLGIKLMKKVS